MTKARFEVPPSYIAAATRRQRYLDYIIAHPGCTTVEAEGYVMKEFEDKITGGCTLHQMRDLGEIHVETRGRLNLYYALKTETMSAKEMHERRKLAVTSKEKEREPLAASKNAHLEGKPGYYRHKPSGYHSHGGQGAVRPRAYPGISQEPM